MERTSNAGNNNSKYKKRGKKNKAKESFRIIENVIKSKQSTTNNKHTINTQSTINNQDTINTQSTINQDTINTQSRQYANILKKSETKSDICVNESVNFAKNVKYDKIFSPEFYKRRSNFRNTVTKNSNSSYGVWEYTYFQHIIDLSNIFKEYTKELDIKTDTFDFLDVFSKFIYKFSSGKINPYIELLTENTDNLYKEFTIKRNKI